MSLNFWNQLSWGTRLGVLRNCTQPAQFWGSKHLSHPEMAPRIASRTEKIVPRSPATGLCSEVRVRADVSGA